LATSKWHDTTSQRGWRKDEEIVDHHRGVIQPPPSTSRSARRGGADPQFGRILAAYGGIFVAGSLAWGVVDGFRPDRWDLLGATICLIGVAVLMWGPREAAV
jgi:hypothetical protein